MIARLRMAWRFRRFRRNNQDHLLWLRLFEGVGTAPCPDACDECRKLADAGRLRRNADGSWSAWGGGR